MFFLKKNYLKKSQRQIKKNVKAFLSSKGAGFTLLEILLTLGILAIILAISFPVINNIYFSFQLTSERDNLIGVLRKAQSSALTNQNQSYYGVKILENQYAVFRGSSYATRDPAFDEKFAKPSGITSSGLSEIVFFPLSGIPDRTGNFNLSNGRQTISVQINEEGMLNW